VHGMIRAFLPAMIARGSGVAVNFEAAPDLRPKDG
jgi:hypothetical protein